MRRNEFGRGEFMEFMDEFLHDHPSVARDREVGWEIYWNPRHVHLEALYPPDSDVAVKRGAKSGPGRLGAAT